MAPAYADRKHLDLEIAIIGMAGRFSGSPNLRQFWQNLLDGREGISFFNDDELRESGATVEELRRSNYVKAAGILEDCELFDREFFAITPKEAELIDPQHRVFLECAWEAFEDAGYVPEAVPGLVGVFAGTAISSYFLTHVLPNLSQTAALGLFLTSVSNDKDYLPTRTSYKLNLKGPSVSVGTACSTSLVAAHLACKSLLAGECDMALAGGAAIHFPIKTGYVYQEGGILSPDGHCRAFDEQAQGTVCGSGVAAVLLKRFEDAVNDRDHIYAVIRGSAINNDGYRKVGFTAPSIEGQAEVIRLAHFMADVNPDTISYVEAHGTGTAIGDPIEVQALTEAFRTATNRRQFCAMGSVKTNLGHAQEAAGVAGLIKTTLALKHRKLPPSLHFHKPNPKLNIENTPFYINDKLQDWPSSGQPLRAGVSSFGIGGTNVHMVLEEAPRTSGSAPLREWHLLTLSARSPSALEELTTRLCQHLEQNADVNLADAAYTCHVGRKAFAYRRTVICSGRDDAIAALRTVDEMLLNDGLAAGPSVALLFPGKAALSRKAIAELYRAEQTFHKHVEDCLELLTEGKPEVANLFAADSSSSSQAQPASGQNGRQYFNEALFIAQFALAQLWMHWGLQVKAMAGSGVGELVTMSLSGMLSVRDALKMVSLRRRLIDSVSSALNPSTVGNGHSSSAAKLDSQSVTVSSMVSAFAENLKQQFQIAPPILSCFSCSSGEWMRTDHVCSPRYWEAQLEDVPRLADTVSKLSSSGISLVLEVGPGGTLSGFGKDCAPVGQKDKLTVISSLAPTHESAIAMLLESVGKLWVRGWIPNWENFHAGEQRSRVPLPTYPFERTLCRLASSGQPSLLAVSRNRQRSPAEPARQDSGVCEPVMSVEISSEDSKSELAMRAELECKVAEIWQQLLGVKEIGNDDDFFDLGGDSLLVTQFVSRLSEMFPVELPLDSVYDKPTIANIARVLETLLLQKLNTISDKEASRLAALG